MEQDQLQALVEKAVQGDDQAFETLCKFKAKDTLYICIQLMGNVPDGEDASQEVFLQMQKSIRHLKQPKAFTAWHNRIIANTCKWLLRGNKRGTRVPLHLLDFELEEMKLEFLPQSFAEEQEKRTLVLEAMQALPFKYRQVLVLFYYQNLPVKEIANVLGTRVKTVNNLLYAARKALKKQVEKRAGKHPDAVLHGGMAIGAASVLGQILQQDALQRAGAAPFALVEQTLNPDSGGAPQEASTSPSEAAEPPKARQALAAAGARQGFAGLLLTLAAVLAGVALAAVCMVSLSVPTAPAGEVVPQQPSSLQATTAGADNYIAAPPASRQAPSRDIAAQTEPSQSTPKMEAGLPPPQAPPEEELQTSAAQEGQPQVSGAFVFVDEHNDVREEFNGLAQGFVVRLYSGQTLLATLTADEHGRFDFFGPLPDVQAPLRASFELLYGFGLQSGDVSDVWQLALPLAEPLQIPFTDTQPPSAAISFWAEDGAPLEGNVNPHSAEIAIYDDTAVEVTWKIVDGKSTVVSQGAGAKLPLDIEAGPDGPANYILICELTDCAGNKAEAQRGFVVYK